MTKSKTVNFKTTEDSQTMMKQNDGICFGVVGTFVGSQAPKINVEQVPNFEHVCDDTPLGQADKWLENSTGGLNGMKFRTAHLTSLNGGGWSDGGINNL